MNCSNEQYLTRVVKWQRIVIGVLFSALLVLAYSYLREKLEGNVTEAFRDSLLHQNRRQREALARYQQITRDLDRRLTTYERKYGEMKPVRQGQGFYLKGGREYWTVSKRADGSRVLMTITLDGSPERVIVAAPKPDMDMN